MQVLCLFGTRKSKLRVKNELCKQQYTSTVTLFDCIHLAQVKVLCQMPEIMCYYIQFLLCFILMIFRAISKYKPLGACV